jgi:hypothetical protein
MAASLAIEEVELEAMRSGLHTSGRAGRTHTPEYPVNPERISSTAAEAVDQSPAHHAGASSSLRQEWRL